MENKQLVINEETQMKTCAFTGHRVLDGNFSKEKLKKEIKKLIGRGVEIFYNGVAMGFDLLAAEAVLSLRKKHEKIKLVACVPCYEQEKNYIQKEKERYVKILKNADEVITLSDHYYRGCMQVRDRYMADRADVLLTYCVKSEGGTAFTVQYFQKKYPQKEVIFL